MISILSELENLKPSHPSLIQPPYFRVEKATPTQLRIVEDFKKYKGKTFKYLWLGGKGSGKSYLSSLLLAEFAIQNPQTISALIANTRTQITDTPLPYTVDAIRHAGVPVETRTEVTIEGKRYKSVLVLQLGEDVYSYILIRSFENISMIEGVELDAVWVDEVQSTNDDGIKVVVSRLRGQRAKNPDLPQRLMMCTGLIDYNYEFHWSSKVKWFDKRYNSATEENLHNLPSDYLETLLDIYTEEEIEMFVRGRPSRKVEHRAVFDFSFEDHVLQMPEDPIDPSNVIVSVDFNAAPMCATVWSYQFGRWVCVDEIEMWGATTYDFADELSRRGYGGIIIGDATGNKRDTRSEMNDFDILEDMLPQFEVLRGLMIRRRGRQRSFSNPPVRDTVHAANALLRDKRVVFNRSLLESGGLPASVASCVWDVTGRGIDKRSDRRSDVKVPRTHFADTFRYFAYYVKHFRDNIDSIDSIYDENFFDDDVTNLI